MVAWGKSKVAARSRWLVSRPPSKWLPHTMVLASRGFATLLCLNSKLSVKTVMTWSLTCDCSRRLKLYNNDNNDDDGDDDDDDDNHHDDHDINNIINKSESMEGSGSQLKENVSHWKMHFASMVSESDPSWSFGLYSVSWRQQFQKSSRT